MLFVNDEFYDHDYLQRCYALFESLPVLKHCQGRRLALCLPDPALWIALCLYLRERGGSAFPIHPTTPRAAARRLARAAQCQVLIFHELADTEMLGEMLGDGPNDTRGALIQMSSGTTGEPKCIARSWSAIATEIQSYIRVFPAADELTPVVACPVSHSYGLICGVLVALARGKTPVIVTSLNPRYLMHTLARVDRPLLYASPTLLSMLAKMMPATQRLHAVMTSGAMMASCTFEELRQKTDRLFQQYGCSETGCIAVNPDLQEAGEMGIPLPHLQVSAGKGIDAPKEILTTLGAHNIATGDLGYFNARGMLCFVARLDDTINVAGINVYPQDVENVVLEYPGVDEAVVYKKADPYAGERVCLQFTAAHDIDIDALRVWCAQQLSPYQLPVDIRQVDGIPRLGNGKVNRRALAAPIHGAIHSSGHRDGHVANHRVGQSKAAT